MASQALVGAASANDLTSDGVVNIVDLQTEINAILFGCPFYSVTPRFAIATVSLVNQAWIPSDIPSPGNLAVHAAVGSPTSLVNQAWLPADIPSAGNLAVHAAVAPPASSGKPGVDSRSIFPEPRQFVVLPCRRGAAGKPGESSLDQRRHSKPWGK